MVIALVGYRGSGKTTIGRKLADRLWTKFVDLDELIVKKAGKQIREIFEQYGEGHFRDLESEALRQALEEEDIVLGLGGGTPIREENRQLVRQRAGKTIYLRCDPEVLRARIEADVATAANRPSLTSLGGGLEEIKLVLAQREPFYRQMKDIEVDVTKLTPDEAVARIARLL